MCSKNNQNTYPYLSIGYVKSASIAQGESMDSEIIQVNTFFL